MFIDYSQALLGYMQARQSLRLAEARREMARPEKTVEDYLAYRVAQAGGDSQKVDCRGHRGRVDRIVSFPLDFGPATTNTFYVECKAPGEKPRPEQVREHARLLKLGFAVVVIDSMVAVDAFIERWAPRR